ncbi:MAG: beta-propeller fold lactonase family protein [Candidatus Methylopumilus sp.]
MKHLTLLLAALICSATSYAGEKGNAYVSNQDGGVTVIDLDRMEAVSNIDIQAKSPRGIAVTPDGKYLITANKDDDNISVIDRVSGQLIRHIAVGKNPEFVRVYKNLVFVSTEPSSKGGPPPKPGEAVKEDSDDDKVPAIIAVVDLNKGKKVRQIVGGPETEGVEFSKDGKKIIITNEADNTITIHNFATGKLLKTISTKEFGDRPRGVKVSPDGTYYVVTLEYGNKFMVLDKSFKVTRTVDTGLAPYGVSFDRKGERIFIASSKEKALQVYDAKTFEKIKDISTGNRCWHFSFTPDDKQILLACGKSQALMVIDTESLEKTKEISGTEMPWGVVTYPKSMGSLDQP